MPISERNMVLPGLKGEKMNTYSRFKVNALIQMARTTEISSQRERYITLAEEELNKEEKLEIDSIDLFIESKVKKDKKKNTLRTEVYEKYLSFCHDNSFTPSTKNVLYRTMRENGFLECKVQGNIAIKCIVE